MKEARNRTSVLIHDLYGFFGPRALEIRTDLDRLSRYIDHLDVYTWLHSKRVAQYSYTVADRLGRSEAHKFNIYVAALLHDIGKVNIPERILLKTGTLSPDEWETMKKHPEIGYELVKELESLMIRGIPDTILHHHERYDGLGYPHRMKGNAIPEASRIVAVADSFDAMISNRVYHVAKKPKEAKAEILAHMHTQFDPFIAQTFLDTLRFTEQNELFSKRYTP